MLGVAVPVVSFGGTGHERLEIDVAGYERTQPVREYYDDNWLRVNVAVAVGGFRGEFGATFQVAELMGFRDEFAKLHNSLRGSAALETMEGQLVLRLEGNRLGAIDLRGEAVDKPGIGNRLGFNLSLDRAQLANSLSELNEVLATFPVRDA